MVRFLIDNNIILYRENNIIFRSLKLEPLNNREFVNKAVNFNDKSPELIYKQDNQHMTFYRYIYALLQQYPQSINAIISNLFQGKLPMTFM